MPLSHILPFRVIYQPVNLIPVNDVKERAFVKSSDERVRRFAAILQDNSVETTVRRRLGSDIDAACGQLRG